MLRNLLSGDATFRKFCHFIPIKLTLFHFYLCNCVGTQENKEHRFIERQILWKETMEMRSHHEIYFSGLQNCFSQTLPKFICRENVLLRVTNLMKILNCKFVYRKYKLPQTFLFWHLNNSFHEF